MLAFVVISFTASKLFNLMTLLLSAGSLELSHFYLLWGHSRLGAQASFSCAREIVQSRRSSLDLQHIKICAGPSELLFGP